MISSSKNHLQHLERLSVLDLSTPNLDLSPLDKSINPLDIEEFRNKAKILGFSAFSSLLNREIANRVPVYPLSMQMRGHDVEAKRANEFVTKVRNVFDDVQKTQKTYLYGLPANCTEYSDITCDLTLKATKYKAFRQEFDGFFSTQDTSGSPRVSWKVEHVIARIESKNKGSVFVDAALFVHQDAMKDEEKAFSCISPCVFWPSPIKKNSVPDELLDKIHVFVESYEDKPEQKYLPLHVIIDHVQENTKARMMPRAYLDWSEREWSGTENGIEKLANYAKRRTLLKMGEI